MSAKPKKKYPPNQVYLSAPTRVVLAEYAKRMGMKKSHVLDSAVREFIERHKLVVKS